MYSDDPVSSPAEDLFSRVAYAERIAKATRELSTQVDSAIVALEGPAGSGKTSMLNFVRVMLTRTNSFKVVAFNPWIANDLSSLIMDFFTTLGSTMPGARSRRLRRRLVRYAKKTAPLLGTVSVAGVKVNAEQIVEMFAGDSPIATLRDKLTGALQRLDVPVLVTIDDIDRLQANELILIAKLMRLVGRLPNVYYLVCFNERSVVSIVAGALPGDDTEQRARLYLEKTVQIRFNMPPLDELSAYRMFSSVLEATLARHGIALDDEGRERVLFFYRVLLARGLREPAQIRRFCSYIEPALVLVGSDLDIADFVAVSYLRFSYPQLAEALRPSESLLIGGGHAAGQGQDAGWGERLAEAGVPADDLPGVASVLSCLFPATGAELRSIGPSPPSFAVPANGASSPGHFRRYWQPNTLQVPVDARALEAALREVLDDEPGYLWSMMSFHDLEKAVPTLRQHAPADAPGAAKLLSAFVRLLPYTSYRAGDIPTALPELYAWMVELAGLVDPDDPAGYLRSIAD